MKAYQAYKDSGISWIGQIPQHWEKCRCKDLFTELKEQVGEDSNKYTLLSLTINGVIVRDLSEGKGKFPKDFESYKIVKPDNLVFCLFDVDETPRTVGHVKQIGMLTGAYNVFEVRNANIEYLYHYFISLDDRKSLKPLYKGLRKVIPLPAFMAMSIFLPPLAEQEAIVSYLEEKTAKIDRFVTKKEEQILRLKELREAIIAQAVTRGIQSDVALRPSGIPWLGDIPKHWEVKKMRELIDIYSDKRQFDLSTSRKFGFSNDFNIQFRLLREEVVGNQPRDKVGKKIVNTTMSGMLYLTDVFEHIIDGLYESSFP